VSTPDSPDSPKSPEDVKALQDELEAVRARNAELETKSKPHGPAAIARNTGVVLLLVLATLCMTLAPVTIWGRNLVLNTDRYVKILTPVASNPGVQNLVITAVDKQVNAQIDIQSIVDQTLPPKASILAGPLKGAVSGLVNTITTRFVQSPAFKTLWVQINRTAHTQIVYLLTGKNPTNGALTITSNDELVLQLAPIVAQVKDQLVAAGLTVASHIPVVSTTINIAQVKGITSARKAVKWLNRIADILPWLALALFAGAIAAARRRRRMLMISAYCTIGAMGLVGLGLLIGRDIYLNNIDPNVVPHDTAKYLYDTLVRYLRDGIRIVALIALLVAIGAWLAGPSRRAVAFRQHASTDSDAAVSWVARGAVGRVVTEHTTACRVTIVVLALIVLLFFTSLTLVSFLVIAAVAAVLLLGIETIRNEAGHHHATAPPASV
jgi:hypothetical protein